MYLLKFIQPGKIPINVFQRSKYNYKIWSYLNCRNFCLSRLNSTSRYYTKKHDWISLDENIGTVGITDYAQKALGDIVYVQLPEIDSEVNPSEECGTLESVKAASELFPPVTGTVIEINESLESKPELVNKSCYDKGWIFKLKLKDMKEVDNLLTENEYEEFLKTDVKDE